MYQLVFGPVRVCTPYWFVMFLFLIVKIILHQGKSLQRFACYISTAALFKTLLKAIVIS